MIHNKLVRDKIPVQIRARGATCQTRTLAGNEYWDGLRDKLIEEAREVKSAINRGHLVEELADCQAVIHAICAHFGIDSLELNDAVCQKQRAKGGFGERVCLIESREPERPHEHHSQPCR